MTVRRTWKWVCNIRKRRKKQTACRLPPGWWWYPDGVQGTKQRRNRCPPQMRGRSPSQRYEASRIEMNNSQFDSRVER